MRRTSGHVAHISPGSVVLTGQAAALLAEHLRRVRQPDNPATRMIVEDIRRLARPSHVSRDGMTVASLIARHSTLTTTEAAERLGISSAGIRKRIQRGQLAGQFDGRRWHIRPDDLEKVT